MLHAAPRRALGSAAFNESRESSAAAAAAAAAAADDAERRADGQNNNNNGIGAVLRCTPALVLLCTAMVRFSCAPSSQKTT